MTRHEIHYHLLLRDTTADSVIRTLEHLGGTRSGGHALWLFPSPAGGRVTVELRVASEEAAERLGLSMTIGMFLFDVDSSFEDRWADVLARGLRISSASALRLITEAAAWIDVATSDRDAAVSIVPSLIQTLLAAHEGVAHAGSHVWTSDELRSGGPFTLAEWPFPSITEEFERSEAVFVGKVVAQEQTAPALEPPEGSKYVLNVDEVLRGSLPRTIVVFSRRAEFSMVVGKKYLVFIHSAQGRFAINPRGNSDSVTAAAKTLAEVRHLVASQRRGQA